MPAKAESTQAWELGFKSLLLDDSLSLAGRVLLQDIDDYIQNTFVYDEVQAALNNDGKPVYVAAHFIRRLCRRPVASKVCQLERIRPSNVMQCPVIKAGLESC